jgi:hypothetical protein
MSYLDERDSEESGSLETQVASAVAAEVGKGRGFSRPSAPEPGAGGAEPQTAPVERGGAPKRKQVSRRSRAAGKTDSGQITLTGSFETLDRLVRRATWDRVTYVGLIERMLELYEKHHDPVPEDFVP